MLLLHILGYWSCLDSGWGSSVIWGMYGVSGWWNFMFCSLDCTQLPSSGNVVILQDLLKLIAKRHVQSYYMTICIQGHVCADVLWCTVEVCRCRVWWSLLDMKKLGSFAKSGKGPRGSSSDKFSKAWKVVSLTHPYPSKQPPYWFDWFDCDLFIWGLKGLH